jgi:hypothetical protein
MSRYDDQINAAMSRNVQALTMAAVASERIDGDNAEASRQAEHWLVQEAQFDVEGAIDWRHPEPKTEGKH